LSRSTWDETFFGICDVLAKRSPDPRTRLGSVIVRPNNTVAACGYNGLPRGIEHRPELLERPLKSLYVLHAEENAILSASERLDWYTVYVPIMPCMKCARMIVQVGIREVVVDADRMAAYSSPEYTEQFVHVRELFSEASVDLRFWRAA
jgi:dCMP deaminase